MKYFRRTLFIGAVLLVFFVSLFSCGNTTKVTKVGGVKIDTLRIPIKTTYLADYFQYSHLIINSEEILSGYNYLNSSVDLFNLTTEKIIKSVPIEQYGPNTIASPISAYLFGEDSIMVIGSFDLYLINWAGEIMNKWNLNRNDGGRMMDSYYTGISPNGSLFWDNQYFYFFKRPILNNKGVFSDNFLIKYNIETSKATELDLRYDDRLRQSPKSYEDMWYPQIVPYGEDILYGFPITSNIYTYRPTDDRSTLNEIKSDYNLAYASPIESYPGLSSYNHLHTELVYFRIHVLQDSEYVLRLHRKRRMNIESSPEFVLMVLDNELKNIGEFEIANGERYFPYQTFSNDHGLYLPVKAEFTSEDFLTFLYITLE